LSSLMMGPFGVLIPLACPLAFDPKAAWDTVTKKTVERSDPL
jgi:hypothetical protein